MVDELEVQARQYQQQRAEIDRLIKGGTGEDLQRMIGQISASVKEVREVAATYFAHGQPIPAANNSFSSIASAGYNADHINHKSIMGKFEPLSRGAGITLVPERELDMIPELLAKLAEDRQSMSGTERGKLANLLGTVGKAREFLADTIQTNRQKPTGVVSHEVAARATAALKVLESKLQPQLEAMHKKMVDFEDEFVERHGNSIYKEFIDNLEGKKQVEGEERKKPRGSRIGSFGAGLILGTGLGVVGGVAGTEAVHRMVDAPQPNGSHVRTLDPEEGKPKFLKKLTDPAEREKAKEAEMEGR